MDLPVEDAASAAWDAVIWEFLIPKRAEYVSSLYRFLQDAIRLERGFETEPDDPPSRLDGYSVYEVDGACRGAMRRPPCAS
ncbi:MAG: hypothetical protein HY791_29115 [Deltaproteobacteria bacterium]|nr:hypothetical protein [Deltaproteobacteria bacterium]